MARNPGFRMRGATWGYGKTTWNSLGEKKNIQFLGTLFLAGASPLSLGDSKARGLQKEKIGFRVTKKQLNKIKKLVPKSPIVLFSEISPNRVFFGSIKELTPVQSRPGSLPKTCCFSSYLKNQPTISTHNRPFHSVPPPNQEAPPRLAPRKSPEIPSFQVPSSEFLVCFPRITALRYETRGVNVSQKICLLDTLELSLDTECRHQLLFFAHPFSWFSNQMLSSFCWVLSIQSVFFVNTPCGWSYSLTANKDNNYYLTMNDNKITKYNMFNPNKSKSKIGVGSFFLAQHLLTIGSPLPKNT